MMNVRGVVIFDGSLSGWKRETGLRRGRAVRTSLMEDRGDEVSYSVKDEMLDFEELLGVR